MNGSDDDGQLAWADVRDSAEVMADKFVLFYPHIAQAARVSNPEHTTWFRDMLDKSGNQGMLVYYFDYKSDSRPEFWGERGAGLLELPPGLRQP